MRPWVPLMIVAAMLVFPSATLSTPAQQEPRSASPEGGTSWHSHPYAGPTPVLLEAGHVQPAGGLVVMTARDDLWWGAMNHLPFAQQAIGALICQVPAGSGACAPLPPAEAPGNLVFCGGVSLVDGDNWHSDMDTYVWVGVFDQLGQTPGGGVWCENPRPATTGVVTHWPAH